MRYLPIQPLETATVFSMVKTYLIIHFLLQLYSISAILDGIENNDALKNNRGDVKNNTWTSLIKDLRCFEDFEDHVNFLRQRWVLGAAEWMAGKNGSKQNQKEVLGYSDSEWEFIWSTLFEDGAWAVPPITDVDGNRLKENCAPEMMIQFIAHALHCNNIVFDLMLNRIQFCSGNHISDDNVKFDSPILLYATGSHFQAVFQRDHEHFIGYARELEILQSSSNKTSSNNFETSQVSESVPELRPRATHNLTDQNNPCSDPQSASTTPRLNPKSSQDCLTPDIQSVAAVIKRCSKMLYVSLTAN